MQQKFKLTGVSRPRLVELVKVLQALDPSVYLTLSPTGLRSKTFTTSRDTAMCIEAPISEVGTVAEDPGTEVRIGLYGPASARFLKFLNEFDPASISIEGDVFDYRPDGMRYARSLRIGDGSLTMSVACMEPSLGFVELTAKQEDAAFSNAAVIYEFDLTKEMLAKLTRLSDFLPNDTSMVEIRSGHSGVEVSSPGVFNLSVSTAPVPPSDVSKLFKKFVRRVPPDSYSVKVYKNRIVFASTTSATKIAINLAIEP